MPVFEGNAARKLDELYGDSVDLTRDVPIIGDKSTYEKRIIPVDFKNRIRMPSNLNAGRKLPNVGYMVGNDEFKPPKVPFVDYDQLRKNYFSLPFYYAVKKLSEEYRKRLSKEKEAGISVKSIFKDLLDSTIEMFSQNFDVQFYQTFPKISVWEQYRMGATNIDRLYTVEFRGYEVPVHVIDKDDPAPTADVLKNSISAVRQTYKSPWNGNEAVKFFRGEFATAANKISRGDYGRLIDQVDFNRWFCRMSMYMIQQHSPQTDQKTVTMDDGVTFTVKEYKKKIEKNLLESLSSLKGNAIRYIVEDKIYDGIDYFFDPIQERILKLEKSGLIPEAYTQELVKEEYKVISALVRGLYRNPSRLPLEFDLTPFIGTTGYSTPTAGGVGHA